MRPQHRRRRSRTRVVVDVVIITAIVTVVAATAWYGVLHSGGDGAPTAEVSAQAPPPTAPPVATAVPVVAGPINGVEFTAEQAKVWQGRRPLTVIVENSTDARPQSGLSQADLVYEALAEGGITRHLAVFLTNTQDVRIGPVRSMRIYFLDWVEEYGGVAVHVGGNNDALRRIGPEGVADLDQISIGGPTFERTTDRAAPHNVYTSTDRLWAAVADKGFAGPSPLPAWTFKSDAPAAMPAPVPSLHLGFLGDAGYIVDWAYSPGTNSYIRSVGGAPAIDRGNGNPVTAKTVIVEEVPYRLIPHDTALDMADVGSGKAHILLDGKVIEATWSKTSRTDRTVFTDDAGQPVPLNRGPIWIEVVPPGSQINY